MCRTLPLPIGLALCFLPASPALGQIRNGKPEMLRVTDRVYCATGYSLGNVIFIVTDKSVVVVDTTESPPAARDILQAFRKISALPVSAIIYTHHHGDHINGAKVFKGETTKVIAQRNFVSELAKYKLLIDYNRRVNARQFGATLPQSERGVSLAPDRYGQANPEIGYVPPTVLFDEKYDFEEGGVRIELSHTQGETIDHVMVWLPQERVLLPGDLFYPSFPMLASPMKPVRPVAEWAESLERMRKLRPVHLVGSHGMPLRGNEQIDTALANYAKAIRYVHDETVKGINRGSSLEEIRRQVRLPEELARLPYLAPTYGRVEWAVNGIYRLYTGWYDLDPAHLNPGRRDALQRALLEAAGGADTLVKRARQALRDGEPQLAIDLAAIVLGAEPGHRAAHVLCAEAFQTLGDAAENSIERNIYRSAAQEHKRSGEK